MTRRMIDASEDLLHDIRRVDDERKRLGWSVLDHDNASLMREIGLTDEEIIARLGYNPLATAVAEDPLPSRAA